MAQFQALRESLQDAEELLRTAGEDEEKQMEAMVHLRDAKDIAGMPVGPVVLLPAEVREATANAYHAAVAGRDFEKAAELARAALDALGPEESAGIPGVAPQVADMPGEGWTAEKADSLVRIYMALDAHAKADDVERRLPEVDPEGAELVAAAYRRIRDRLVEESGLFDSVEAALAVFEASEGTPPLAAVSCVFCSWRAEVREEEINTTLREHVKTCPGHPMRELEARLAVRSAGDRRPG